MPRWPSIVIDGLSSLCSVTTPLTSIIDGEHDKRRNLAKHLVSGCWMKAILVLVLRYFEAKVTRNRPFCLQLGDIVDALPANKNPNYPETS